MTNRSKTIFTFDSVLYEHGLKIRLHKRFLPSLSAAPVSDSLMSLDDILLYCDQDVTHFLYSGKINHRQNIKSIIKVTDKRFRLSVTAS